MSLQVCTTNIDLHFKTKKLSEVSKFWNVEEGEIREQHCLGLCFMCQQKPVAWKDNSIYAG